MIALGAVLRPLLLDAALWTRACGMQQRGCTQRRGMMLNKVLVAGRLGQDPKLRRTEKVTIAEFSVACDSYYKEKKQTEWIPIVCFGATAENAGKYLTKGRSVLVEGRYHTNRYEKDGVKKSYTQVIAERVQFLGGLGGADDDRDVPI